ncbi:MAG: arylsulfatase [Pirellulaceae bacterium]|nr:arylsulfatase [Pirellulaceae bacterium]
MKMLDLTVHRCNFLLAICLSITWQSAVAFATELQTNRPNIVYILADDLGIGDLQSFNAEGKIATPNIDELAAGGMRFTDAHSGSAVCTPTRYGVLTGRYAWRTRLQSGVCWGYSTPLIDRGRMTVASLLKSQGYHTGCVGKWHLGLEWALKDKNKKPSDNPNESWHNIDFTRPISSGPNQIGFNYFFGISASLDMHPYVYIENDRVTQVPEQIVARSNGKKFWREGPISNDFKHVEVLDRLTEKAVKYIHSQSSAKPFFLYLPLTAPHKPIIPDSRFLDQSGLNEWGDFVMQVDWTIGQVKETLEAKGLSENTLFIVTSDNGATPGADFPALGKHGHDPSGKLRGHKADIFEGGHRVAFVAHWPAVIKAGTVTEFPICHTDLLATVADILDFELPADAGEDSVSILPFMNQTTKEPLREAVVHHSVNGSFAIRHGQWKLCFCPGSGGWSSPRPPQARKEELPSVQLYDLAADLGETKNLQGSKPLVVEKLTALMQRYVDQGRSTVGEKQANGRRVQFLGK